MYIYVCTITLAHSLSAGGGGVSVCTAICEFEIQKTLDVGLVCVCWSVSFLESVLHIMHSLCLVGFL